MAMFRLPDLALGELEQEVLEVLWMHGRMKPADVHDEVVRKRKITQNTVSSALKRLHEKGLLSREKVSHWYVYEAAVSRSELQREMISAVASRFGTGSKGGLLAAFVDVAEAEGEESLRQLEQMIVDRLSDESDKDGDL